ncbi:MAG: zinc-binding dehydrogenase, partial [Planctomycetia bacterium]
VVVMDMSADRLAFARARMGVADTLHARGGADDVAAVADLTGGRMAEVVVDATGSAASMAAALALAGFGGRLVYVGITQGEIVFPHAPVMHRRELTLLASRNALSRNFNRIIGLIEAERIDKRQWLTHHVPFADTIRAFPGFLEPASGVIKAVVEMPA